MPIIYNDKKFYQTKEAYAEAGISRATFFRWIKLGIIQDASTRDRRGWRLFTEAEVRRLKAEAQRIRRIPEQADLFE